MARKPSSKATQSANMSEAAALLKEQGLEILKPNVKSSVIIPFGISALDHDILGTGGLVGGIITQFWGPQRSGKTTMALRAVAQAQRMFPDKVAVYFDSEFAIDEQRARDAGVDWEKLQLLQGTNIAEEVYGPMLRYVASGAASIVVLDTLANLIPKDRSTNLDTDKKEGGKAMPGMFARVTKAFAQDFCRYIHQHAVVALVLNQQTMKIGVLFGDPTDYPGGENFRHNIQMSLRLRQVETVKEGPEKTPVGIKISVNVEKNKKAPEKKTDDNSHPVFYFKEGIEKSASESLFDDAIRKGFLVAGRSGAYRLIDLEGQDIQKWRGRDNVKKELAENSDLANRIAELVYRSGGALPPQTFDEQEVPEVSE